MSDNIPQYKEDNRTTFTLCKGEILSSTPYPMISEYIDVSESQ